MLYFGQGSTKGRMKGMNDARGGEEGNWRNGSASS